MKTAIIENNVIDTASIRDILFVLDKTALGIVIVVDSLEKILGLMTDGDIRRALLKGANLDSPVSQYMQTKFVAGSNKLSHKENLKLLESERIQYVPILDEDSRPINMISWRQMQRLPVAQPSLGGNELKYVTDCISSNWISSQGNYVTQFEQEFANYIGSKYCLTTSSGTTALHLALKALDIGEEDEVIVPNLTFAAPANVVLHCGAKLVLVDVDPNHWTISIEDLLTKISPKTKAIIAVHLYGHPCDMEPILDVAKEKNIFVIEDCAESLGASYKGIKTGNFGHIACFSFFANKVITTGEGGMVATNDVVLFEKLTILRDHGMVKEKRYWHVYAGYNYRMTNLQAAIGLAQLEQIEKFISNRIGLAKCYDNYLKDSTEITLPPNKEWAQNIYWLYSILLPSSNMVTELAKRLHQEGIETRGFFYPLHIQPPYQAHYAETDFKIATDLAQRGLCLPTSNDLRPEDAIRVCNAIKKILKTII